MPTDPTPVNPYQPTVEVSEPQVAPESDPESPPEPATLGRVAVRWFVVCGISAVPSFFFGFLVTSGQIAGMLLGIFLFAVGYTLIDHSTANWPLRQKRLIRRTLRFTYGTRIAISIIFPVGMYLDLLCGAVSMGIVNSVFVDGMEFGSDSQMTFFSTLFTTLVQGCVLNVVLAIYGSLVLGVHAAATALKGRLGNHS